MPDQTQNLTERDQAKIAQEYLAREFYVPEAVLAMPQDNPFREDYVTAVMIRNSDFVPEGCRGSVTNTFYFLNFARELGFNWSQACQALFMPPVKGTKSVGMYATAVLALLRKRGFDVAFSVDEAEKVTCTITRPAEDGKKAPSQSITWTKKRADETMVFADGSQKPLSAKWNWTGAQCQVMLRYRALMECARIIASDVVLGIYSEDEIEDISERQKIEAGPVTGQKLIKSSGVEEANGIDESIVPVEEQQRLRQAADICKIATAVVTQELLEIQKQAQGDPERVPPLIAAKIHEWTAPKKRKPRAPRKKAAAPQQEASAEQAEPKPPPEEPKKEPASDEEDLLGF